MRFWLRIATLATLSMAAVVGHAQGLTFYFSDKGGTNERLTTAVVSVPNWVGEFDVIVQNLGSTPIIFNAGAVFIGFASTTTFGPLAEVTPGSDKVTIFDVGNATDRVEVNPNITGRASWFAGIYACNIGGGRNGPPTGQPRPYGFNVTVDTPTGLFATLPVGGNLRIMTIKFKDNGLFGNAEFHDLSIYDAGTGSSFTTFLLNGSNGPTYFRPGPTLEQDSGLRLMVPETGITLALTAGFGFLISRRRRSVINR